MSGRVRHAVTAIAAVAAAGFLPVGAVESASAVVSPAALSSATARGTLTDFGFDAHSYGSRTTGNDTAQSGATAASHFPCTRYVPRTTENFLATAGDGDGVALSGVRTRNYSHRADGAVSIFSTVRIDSGSMAGGQIAFENLRGVGRSYHRASGFHALTVSRIGTLTIGGVPVPLPNDGEEREILIPGSGTLYLNYARTSESRFHAGATVNVLRFVANDGTVERVGKATSRIDGQVEGGVFRGSAWASDARTGGLAALGRAAVRPIPCAGTRGKILESGNANATVTEVGVFGARRSFAYGIQRDKSATGYTRSEVDNASFGAGVLEFRNIKGRANVTRQADGDLLRNAKGTGVGTIRVNGQQVPTPPAGEAQDVAGLGSYTVRVVNKTRTGIDVTGIIVRIENGTPADRSDDTVVNLARATLGIKRG
ncbi:MAG: Multimodular transpeptidase-transglycosylase [uncultured Nocardioidaceae bacterium]|uniref:Multimodular transpeptidase-transglycosylase n=1 Tax=uncultured Nocardioidaceae bacterium TaxID=253824 RepID=A0A6J4L3J8_9ACTN|nr:MAG: Multimodular transpeptidase-transglycosylase [uncultured Nocardioidaceae bacterium]